MLKIVLADDEFYFRQAMKLYLSEWEDEYCLVGEARNGKEGLELIRQLRPDIVLMDINMQIMSGLEAVQILYEEKIPVKTILLTGYSEFEYAHKAIRYGVFDYLLKPISKQDLKKCLDQAAAQIRSEQQYKELQIKYYNASFKVKEHFVNKIFSAKKESDWAEVERTAREFLNPDEQFSYQAFLINIYADEEEHSREKEHSFYFFTISNILTELFERKGIQCFTSSDNNSMRAVVSADMPVDELEKVMLEIQENARDFIQKMIDHPILISIGSARGRLREIENSVQEADKVQKFMRMYRKTGVCTSAQLNFGEESTRRFFGNLYSQFVMIIRTNNITEMETLVKEYFQEMKENQERPEIVVQRARNMVSCAFDVLQAQAQGGDGKNEGKNDSSEFMFPLKFEEDSIEVIQAKVLRYITEGMRAVNERAAKRKSSLSVNVANYIEKNYQRYDLSLMDLSTTFGMSKTILCQQFKEAFGITIGEYILQCRMMRAIGMMDEGYRNVAYVAEKCGYEDAGYFSKCFKKHFGISPKDYCEKGAEGRWNF